MTDKDKRLKDYVLEAVNFLKQNLSDKGKIFVAFSGGKDSTVIAKLMEISELNYQLYYSFTGIDPPELVRFIRENYRECTFLHPKKSFWKDLESHIPPSSKIRWCCTSLKKEPSYKINLFHRVEGIRSEESSRRAKYKRVNHFEKLGITKYYPILEWKEWQVWEFIGDYSLEYCKLYDEGFGRIGCVICPFNSKGSKQLHCKKRWPKFFKKFEETIEILYQKRMKQGRIMNFPDSRGFCEAWYKDDSARWYKDENTKKPIWEEENLQAINI